MTSRHHFERKQRCLNRQTRRLLTRERRAGDYAGYRNRDERAAKNVAPTTRPRPCDGTADIANIPIKRYYCRVAPA